MKSWPAPFVPAVPGHGDPLHLFDTQTRSVRPVDAGPVARLYVCGITPYDATHLGHAATYVTFDLVGRALRDAGHRVHYVQNVTDVDDPLLERARRDGRDWRELATAEIDLFREDMTALAVVPPDALVGVVESMPEITREVRSPARRGHGVPRPRAGRRRGRRRRLPRPHPGTHLRVGLGLDGAADGCRLRRPWG